MRGCADLPIADPGEPSLDERRMQATHAMAFNNRQGYEAHICLSQGRAALPLPSAASRSLPGNCCTLVRPNHKAMRACLGDDQPALHFIMTAVSLPRVAHAR